MYLRLEACSVVDPSTGEAEVVDVGIEDGKIDAVGEVAEGKADRSIDAKGKLLVPALVDLHTHVYYGGTSLGVDADLLARRSGVGVFVDAGSAGAGNFIGFRDHVIKRSSSTIYSFLNLGFGGIPFFGIQRNSQASEIPSLGVADEEACIECIEANRRYVVGIKIRLSDKANGELGAQLLRMAKRCSAKLGVPVMLHIGNPPPYVKDLIKLLGRGDILTHSFRSRPNSILEGDQEGGRVSRSLRAARERGVIIDIGHGMGSFSFATAKAALEDGFIPDTISTDAHRLSIPYPVHDLPMTMTKFLNLGMAVGDIIRSVTYNPAAAIGKPRHGTLAVGRQADLLVLEVADIRTSAVDSAGVELKIDRMFRPLLRVTGDEVSRVAWRGPTDG
jgi:dihydroorotase